MSKSDFVRVDNNTTHIICLPPKPELGFDNGHQLVPGLNKVPADLIEALRTFKVPYIQDGRRGTRTLFEDLAEPSKTSGGKASVVVLGAVSPDAEEGPEPPHSLAEYGETLAIKLIEFTQNKAALERWSKDRRAEVAAAAAKKLGR